jgi:hypothetical protein
MAVLASTLSCAMAFLNTTESGEPAERIQTTLTPFGPSSAARFLENPSMALHAGPKPPVSG